MLDSTTIPSDSIQVSSTLTFEQKIHNRIRDSIGDLMSEEDLKKLVHGTFDTVFFKPRANPKYTGHYNSYEKPTIEPLSTEIIRTLLQPVFEEQVKLWLAQNKEQVLEVIGKKLEQDAGQLLLAAIANSFQVPLMNLRANVQSVINNLPG